MGVASDVSGQGTGQAGHPAGHTRVCGEAMSHELILTPGQLMRAMELESRSELDLAKAKAFLYRFLEANNEDDLDPRQDALDRLAKDVKVWLP